MCEQMKGNGAGRTSALYSPFTGARTIRPSRSAYSASWQLWNQTFDDSTDCDVEENEPPELTIGNCGGRIRLLINDYQAIA